MFEEEKGSVDDDETMDDVTEEKDGEPGQAFVVAPRYAQCGIRTPRRLHWPYQAVTRYPRKERWERRNVSGPEQWPTAKNRKSHGAMRNPKKAGT